MPREVACQVSGPSVRLSHPRVALSPLHVAVIPTMETRLVHLGRGWMRNHWLRPARWAERHQVPHPVHLPCMLCLPRSCPLPARYPSLHPFLTSGWKVHTAKLGCRTAQSKSNGCTTPLISLQMQQTYPGSKDHELEEGGWGGRMARRRTSSSQMHSGRGHLVKPVTFLWMTVALPILPDSFSRGESLY